MKRPAGAKRFVRTNTHPVGCLLRPLGLSKRAGCVMGSTASTPSEEEAALPPETKAMSCSVEELQKCLKETGGDRTKCEREIEEVGISLAHSLAPKFIDFAYAMRPARMCLGCHLSTCCHRIVRAVIDDCTPATLPSSCP